MAAISSELTEGNDAEDGSTAISLEIRIQSIFRPLS